MCANVLTRDQQIAALADAAEAAWQMCGRQRLAMLECALDNSFKLTPDLESAAVQLFSARVAAAR